MFDHSLTSRSVEPASVIGWRLLAGAFAAVCTAATVWGVYSVNREVSVRPQIPAPSVAPVFEVEKKAGGEGYVLCEKGKTFNNNDVGSIYPMVAAGEDEICSPFKPDQTRDHQLEMALRDMSNGLGRDDRFVLTKSGLLEVFQEAGNVYTVVRATREAADGRIETVRTHRVGGLSFETHEPPALTLDQVTVLKKLMRDAQNYAVQRHNMVLKSAPMPGAPEP